MYSLNQMKQLVTLVIVAALVIGFGLFIRYKQTGKWICSEGIWVAQGKPVSPKPGLYCKQ